MSETPEKINHPAHYGGAEDPYEAIKVIEAWGAGFCTGNALKYICRAGRKPGEETLVDLRKALWYLEREVTRLGGATKTRPLSNPEARALLAKGRDEWAQHLHQILDGCGVGAAPLRERVETLAAAYKEAVDTLRAEGPPSGGPTSPSALEEALAGLQTQLLETATEEGPDALLIATRALGYAISIIEALRRGFNDDLQKIDSAASRRAEAIHLHRLLDDLGVDPGNLRRRVEDLAGSAAQLHRAFYPGEEVTFSAGSFRYPEGRTRGQPMPAVTRVRLEAERDEAIAKAEGLQAEADELTKAGTWLKKQANEAAAERDEAQAGEREALAEVVKLREEIEALRYHERRGRWTTVRVDRLEHLEAIERRAQGPAGGYTAEGERVGIDPLLACEVKP